MTEKAPPAGPACILIVDDVPANLELLGDILKAQGYKVRSALNGKLALLSARNSRPDLLLLDISMPEMDGYEVCARLKADAQLKEIPVVFLSASGETADKVNAFSAGGADYITKPFQVEEVLARVRAQLALRQAAEFLEEKNRFLEYTFSRFVSPKVVETMKRRPLSEFLRMERREVTVLFADLRGFTELSGAVPPEELQETLNSVLEVLVDRVQEADGLVDKFLGDGLMALFGAPFAQQDHAARALEAAVGMQAAHRLWQARRAAGRRPERPLGVGLASGSVVAGAYGTSSRMEYTALGSAVNLASRLCGAAAAGEILTVPETLRMAGGRFSFASKGKMLFKNMAEPVEVILITEVERYAKER